MSENKKIPVSVINALQLAQAQAALARARAENAQLNFALMVAHVERDYQVRLDTAVLQPDGTVVESQLPGTPPVSE